MARRVTVDVLCDPCMAKGEESVAEELPALSLGRGKPRVLAFCEVHRKELWEPLLEAWSEYGQPVTGDLAPPAVTTRQGAIAAAGRFECPSPGCDYTTTTRLLLMGHTRKKHGVTLAELEGKPLPHECPDCGRKFSGPQGMAVHRARIHK